MCYCSKEITLGVQRSWTFTIPYIIREKLFTHYLIGLSASINVMTYFVYKSLNLKVLKNTNIMIQLADKYALYPLKVVEDMLVQMLIFLIDFYIIVILDDHNPNSSAILLGKPFFKIFSTKIGVFNGALTMDFDGEIRQFNINSLS